jgi:DNA-binding Lrp family transcriptional regulator
MARQEICSSEVDFYILQCLRNDSRRSEEEIYRRAKEEIPEVKKEDLAQARGRVESLIKRYSAVIDPFLGELIPFYAFINVRENFKFVTDAIRKNIEKVVKKETGRLIAVYDLIGKPDFMIIGLTKGMQGRRAEQYIHSILSEMGGEGIHGYLTTQVEIPRAIKKFWHANFEILDFEERAKEVREIKGEIDKRDIAILRELQRDCRAQVDLGRTKVLEDLKIIRGYSVVIDPKEYPSRHWNFVKAFIQVDLLYNKFNDLYGLLEEAYSREIRGMVQIPYSRYGVLVECEIANISRLSKIMGAIRNQDYVRTTRTAIARDVIWEDLWVI